MNMWGEMIVRLSDIVLETIIAFNMDSYEFCLASGNDINSISTT